MQVNTHLTPRPILLTRHGESLYNVRGRIGGDTAIRFLSSKHLEDDIYIYVCEHFIIHLILSKRTKITFF